MLEFCKTVLNAVSFDSKLFEKELYKSLISVSTSDLPELRQWCYQNFNDRLADVLNKAFKGNPGYRLSV